MNIKKIPQSERPYEKLEMYGAQALSNAELLAIIIKSGTKEESSIVLAQKILSMQKNTQDSLRFLQDISIKEFMSIKGIGKVKAIQLLAVCELTKRISRPINNFNIQIKSPQDVANLLINELKYEKREIVKVLMLNSKNNVLKIQDVAYGGTSFAVFEIKDVLKEAIKIGAKFVMVLGDNEIESGVAKLKNMATGEQTDIRLDNTIAENFSNALMADMFKDIDADIEKFIGKEN